MPKINQDEWRVEKVKIMADFSPGVARQVEVDALVLGTLAFHRAITDDPVKKHCLAVSSINSGDHIVLVKTEEDAVKVVETLWEAASDAFELPTRERIVERLPAWVKPWIRECRVRVAWVDPATHKTGTAT